MWDEASDKQPGDLTQTGDIFDFEGRESIFAEVDLSRGTAQYAADWSHTLVLRDSVSVSAELLMLKIHQRIGEGAIPPLKISIPRKKTMAQGDDVGLPTYTIEMLPPPGSVIAPHGFPANPRPQGAPKVFLDAMEVRIRVFCDEQNCALEPELDEDDLRSWHWVLYQTTAPSQSGDQSPPEPVSVIRIVPPPHGPHPNGYEDSAEDPYCKLGRVATMAHARGKGLSRRLVEAAFEWLAKNHQDIGHGWTGNVLAHAQVDVEKMYNRLGFVTDDKLGRWDEEGIEHVGMWRTVQFDKA